MKKKKIIKLVVLYVLFVTLMVTGLIIIANIKYEDKTILTGANMSLQKISNKCYVLEESEEYIIYYKNGENAVFDGSNCDNINGYFEINDGSDENIQNIEYLESDSIYKNATYFVSEAKYYLEIATYEGKPFDHIKIQTNNGNKYVYFEDCVFIPISYMCVFSLGAEDVITSIEIFMDGTYCSDINYYVVEHSNKEVFLPISVTLIVLSIASLSLAVINTVQFKNKNSLYNKKLELKTQGIEIKHKKAKEILAIWQEFKSARNRNEVLNIVENSKLNFKVKYITCEYCGVENDITKNTCEKCGGKLRRL